MMDLIIPYKKTNDDGFELRQSLRSLEKYGKDYDKIIIICNEGEEPKWLQSVCFVHSNGKFDRRAQGFNIYDKIMTVCKWASISENFIFWNDDFYLTRETDLSTYPNFNCGDLFELIDARKERFDAYKIQAQNTFKVLVSHGKPTLNYDLHCPIIYNKKLFESVMMQYDWEISQGYCIKSLYANHLKLESLYMPDNNFDGRINGTIKSMVEKGHIFSIHPGGLTDEMKKYLEESYPNKSKWEI